MYEIFIIFTTKTININCMYTVFLKLTLKQFHLLLLYFQSNSIKVDALIIHKCRHAV